MMDGIVGPRILRCSRGHLFTSSESGRLFGSFHFGPTRLMPCPIDGRWGFMTNVDSRSLSEQELAEAAQNRY
jgi:hypothetical protein